jgi:hypothetical protein
MLPIYRPTSYALSFPQQKKSTELTLECNCHNQGVAHADHNSGNAATTTFNLLGADFLYSESFDKPAKILRRVDDLEHFPIAHPRICSKTLEQLEMVGPKKD